MAKQEVFEHGYAVVIGVNDNKIPRLALPTVENDVIAVYDVLIHPERCAYNEENVRLLKGEKSTKDEILDALDWLKQKVDADPEATAVIYYSGHGMEDKEADKYYLIPYDIEDLGRIRRYAIPAEDFSDEVARIQAKRTLIMLDCCHAAGMKAKDIDLTAVEAQNVNAVAFPLDTLPKAKNIPVYDGVPGATSKAVSDLLEGEGRAILNSSTGSQSSWVPSGGKISIFTQHLIEALTGHAPHDDEDTTVLVTDVMSWVTRKVEKTAEANGVEQTPVMRTDGVFPIAQLMGGKGVAISKGAIPPDPLAPLPKTGTINTGGDYVGGDKVGGDKVMGRDKFEGINISGVQGSNIAVGVGNTATTTTTTNTTYQGSGQNDNLAALFAPLQRLAAQQAPALVGKVNALKAEVAKGSGADDNVVAGLVVDLAEGAPGVKPTLAELFKNPQVAVAAGPATKFTTSRLG